MGCHLGCIGCPLICNGCSKVAIGWHSFMFGYGMMHTTTYCLLGALWCILDANRCYHGTSSYCLCGSRLDCVPWGLCGLLFHWSNHSFFCLILVFVAQTNNIIICHLRHFTLFGACTTCHNSICCTPHSPKLLLQY